MLLDRLLTDAQAFVSDPLAWWALLVGAGAFCLLVGVGWAAAVRIGLLHAASPAGAVIGVGLGFGAIVVVLVFASLRTSGASAYVPATLFIAAALAMGKGHVRLGRPRRSVLLSAFAALATAGAWAFLFGITMSPSPRDGVQPVEFMDEPFYAVLARYLIETGQEFVYAPAGFGAIAELPRQSWYHWGEIWLAAATLLVPGISAMHARHLIALPILITATMWMIGAISARSSPVAHRREAFALGAFGMACVAPIPLLLEDHFDWWARGIGFSITLYGLSYVAVALGLYALLGSHRDRSAFAFLAAITAVLVASHILVAVVTAVGLLVAGTAYVILGPHHRVELVRRTRPILGASALAVVTTLTWGFATGHGLGGDRAVEGVAPFDDAWRRAVILVIVGSGVLIVGPALAILGRRTPPTISALVLGACAAVGAGAIAWGLRLATFNMFHIFFGAVAVVLTPLAVIAIVTYATDRRADAPKVATALIAVLLCQAAIGAAATVQRFYEFGPGEYEPVPVAALEHIRSLPSTAKLAYACENFEEVATWDARLISITAHTGRPVVPMCFQSDTIGPQIGTTPDATVANPFFAFAPQRELYPDAQAQPSPAAIRAFLDRHAIDYVWEDPDHPNSLVPDALLEFASGPFRIYRVT